jgi:hypothetical protein
MEQLAISLNSTYIKAVYPDAGVAAMLSHQWPDRGFNIASLNDRKCVGGRGAPPELQRTSGLSWPLAFTLHTELAAFQHSGAETHVG